MKDTPSGHTVQDRDPNETQKRDHEKFSRLLESMKGDLRKRSEKIAVSELEKILSDFEDFKRRKNISLSDSEIKKIQAITGAHVTPHVKKRMMEDIIYSIKSRHQQQYSDSQARERADREISTMKDMQGTFSGWLQLTRFALQYGTITLFTHRLKEKSFSLLRGKTSASVEIITEGIEETLSAEYYTLTNIEYNSLEIITQLHGPLEDINHIKQETSYHPYAIDSVMDAFTRVYGVILSNSDIIIQSAKKSFEKKKAPHGFFGVLYDLIDRPIFDNRPLSRSRGENIRNSIPGVLFSYYSTRMGCRVTTINQILYIIQAEPSLDSSKKHLTPGAIATEEKRRENKDDDNQRLLNSYHELERIIERYLPRGIELEEKLYRVSTGTKYQAWIEEHRTKPALRIRRLLEGIISFFVEGIADEDGFILEYDGKQYKGFFSGNSALKEAVAVYNLYEFDLAASRAADLSKLTVPDTLKAEEYLHHLTLPEAPRTVYSPIESDVRQMLLTISRRSYILAGELNRIITDFYSQKELIPEMTESGFDFFTSAVVSKTRAIKAHRVLNVQEITLRQYLEDTCALAFHIALLLNHPGVTEMKKEMEILKLKAEAIISKRKDSSLQHPDTITDIDSLYGFDADIDESALHIYRDTLTGLWKQEFHQDYVIPDIYDTDNRYYSDTLRFVFAASIDTIDSINSAHGHDIGDRVIIMVSRIFLNYICHTCGEKKNIVFRYNGNLLSGYITNMPHASVLDILNSIHRSAAEITIDTGDKVLSSIPLSIGVYQEHRGTDVYENIGTAVKIMDFVQRHRGNNIGFVKNQHRIITSRDYNRNGAIDDSLLTMLHTTR
ncbi:MAG TPA: diguanylate cyclase [Spirochaetota bacterium]|nr:diguanylate cyclase [Spirochaetota bacterium]